MKYNELTMRVERVSKLREWYLRFTDDGDFIGLKVGLMVLTLVLASFGVVDY